MRTAYAAVVASLVLTILTGAAQDRPVPAARPQETFRSGVEYVHLDVSVLDRQRMPVRGLTKADFTVLDEGVPQTIEAFSAVDLPDVVTTGAAWRRSVAPDVVSNRFDAQRVVVILMDDFGVPFDPGVTKIAKTIGHAVIDHLGPADLGAVVYTLGRTEGQEFTTSRTRLGDAVDRFLPSGLDLPRQPNRFLASEPNRLPNMPSQTRMPSGACLGSRCVTEAFEKVAEALLAWPGGRKTLVFISPAMGISTANLEDAQLRDDLRTAIGAMQRANLNVYHFDPRGLETGRYPDDDFGIFADNTGGRAIHDTNTPWEMVPQVFRENSSYYLLAFRSTRPRDGRFNKLTVKVARPDVEVRTRSGYRASPDRPPKPSKKPQPTSLERAISGGLPTGDVPLSLTTAPFARAGRKEASLLVVAGLERGADAPASETVEMDVVAFDSKWKPARAFHQSVELKRPANADAEMHVDLGSRLDLAPGRYEVRVAAQIAGSDRAGSVYTSVTIPDYTKAPLTLSGVVLQREPASPASAAVSEVVPVAPTTVREFSPDDRVTAFFRIYRGGRQALTPVSLTVRIVDAEDRTVTTETTVVDAASFESGRAADRRVAVPLSQLLPGAYMLSIGVTAGNRPPVEQAVIFRVR